MSEAINRRRAAALLLLDGRPIPPLRENNVTLIDRRGVGLDNTLYYWGRGGGIVPMRYSQDQRGTWVKAPNDDPQ